MPQWTQWPHWKSQVDPYAEGHSHKHGTTSEAAMRKALGQLHGWQDPNVQKEAPKAKLGLKLKTPSRRTPMKIDSEHYPLSPDMIPASKARRAQQQNLPAALPSGTRLNVWWSDEEEPFECEVMEWRLVSEAGAERPVYMHRCQYEGGVIDHDLAEIVFEVVPGTMASSLLKQESARAASARLHGANAKMTENLSPPSSPLKSTVIKRGRLAMWEKPKTSSEMIAEAHKDLKSKGPQTKQPSGDEGKHAPGTPSWHREMLSANLGGKGLGDATKITITAFANSTLDGVEAEVFGPNSPYFDYDCRAP